MASYGKCLKCHKPKRFYARSLCTLCYCRPYQKAYRLLHSKNKFKGGKQQ